MPKSYFKSNFEGFMNIINLSKINKITKFIFASSSSVYGDQKKFPINEKTKITPKNIYAATKKINEEIGEDLSKITEMKVIGLRFFTVYGKYGRPDMFVFKYLNSLINQKNFNLFNNGNHLRDYTHIDDVVEMMDLLIKKKMNKKFEIFNICSNKPIDINNLSLFIAKYIGKKPKLIFRARNQIEVIKTHGDNRKILKFLKYKIKKNIYLELPKIINWYKQNKIWNYKS